MAHCGCFVWTSSLLWVAVLAGLGCPNHSAAGFEACGAFCVVAGMGLAGGGAICAHRSAQRGDGGQMTAVIFRQRAHRLTHGQHDHHGLGAPSHAGVPLRQQLDAMCQTRVARRFAGRDGQLEFIVWIHGKSLRS